MWPLVAVWVPTFLVSSISSAQSHEQHVDSARRIAAGAHAIGVVTRQSPALAGSALTEGYVTQPTFTAHASGWNGALTVQGMLSLEGLTMERGELNPGIVGEGYIDRRHPHTYLHELTATLDHHVGSFRASGTVGKGFAPFGTDDPMVRPFEKYPINHHLAQILERIVAVAAVRGGPLIIEAGLFNGDEPESPGDAPNHSRLWDSWAARITLTPFQGVEVQSSHARVRSPENARGGGPDDRKWSASMRFEDSSRTRYALVEWARTGHHVPSSPTFEFNSLLMEGAGSFSRFAAAFRLERTERPDEERLSDPFRTAVPGNDFSILGRSRWSIASARISAPLAPARNLRLDPFIELAHLRVTETLTPSGFNPTQFYGSDRIWTLSLGVRLGLGMAHARMGRYGAAIPGERGMTAHARVTPAHEH